MSAINSIAVIAQSKAMHTILRRIDTIATSNHSVLLIGETGVGKELIAEYIHQISPRSQEPMVKVGLSALPHDLLESELFGHEKGAFTNAMTDKRGLFELANRGTIFLDDIDDVPLTTQTKLLRVLESRELMRVGGITAQPIDVRVISASKVDLKQLVDSNSFRPDLYYRLNVVPIVIPPLRERREDIPLLAEHFIRLFVPNSPIALTPDAIDSMTSYPWPGNIRELRNVLQRVTLFAEGQIDVGDLPPEIRNNHPIDDIMKACNSCFANDGMSLDQMLACLESNLLNQALQQAHGNRSQAAKILKMSLSTLRDRLKKHNLDSPE